MDQEKGLSDKKEACIRKRNRITFQQKKEICEYKRKHPGAFAREIFLHFRNKWPNIVAPSTISKILMSGDKWLKQHGQDSQRKTCTRIYHPRNIPLERALYKWHTSVKDSMTVSNEILKEKAKALAKLMNIRNFSCSNNWVYSFKKRHRLLKYTHKVTTGKSFLNIDLDYPSDMQENLPSSIGNKISYMEDEFGNGTIYVTAPVSAQEARQGLISAMGYLAAHSGVSRDNIDLLWMIFQQITGEPTAGKMQHSSDNSLDNNNICDEKPIEEAEQTANILDVFNEGVDISPNDKTVSTEVNELNNQHIGKFTNGSIPEVIPTPHSHANLIDEAGDVSGTGKIQLAVEGADGKYLYVMSESDSLEGEFNLNESLPEILQAAGHSLEAGIQFIETTDQCSGLRMISKHIPQLEDDGLIQLITLTSENMADSVSNDVTLADGISGDHAYVTGMSATASDGVVKTEVTAVLPQTKITDSAHQTDMVDALPRMDFSDVTSQLGTTVSSKPEVHVKKCDTGSGSINSKDVNKRCNHNDGMKSHDVRMRTSDISTKCKNDVSKDVKVNIANIDAGVNKRNYSGINDEHAIGEKLNTASCIKARPKQSTISASTVNDSQLSIATSNELQTEFPASQTTTSNVVLSPNSIILKPCSIKLSPLPDSLFSSDTGEEQVRICVHCSKIFMSLANLENHRRSCSKTLNMDGSGLMKSNYPCCFCEKVFSRWSSYKWHMRSHGDGECSCFTCSNKTKNRSKLFVQEDEKKSSVTKKEDAVTESLVSKPSEKGECDVDYTKPHVCHTCGAGFKKASDLQSHSTRFHDSKKWKCLSCERHFLRSADLKRHSRVHLLPPDVSCRTCGKTFVNRSNLHKHSRLHTGIQDYNCSMCGKHFTNSASLKEHKKLHKSVRNKKCGVCGRAFVLVRNLNVHMLTHNEFEKM